MKTPTVEEELRHKHEADEARERLVGTIEEIRHRGHVVEETIEAAPEAAAAALPLVPLALVAFAGLALAVATGDAIHALRRGLVHARRRRAIRRFRRAIRVFG